MATKQDQPLNEWNTRPQKVNVSLGESRTTPQLEGFRAMERMNGSHAEFIKSIDPDNFKNFKATGFTTPPAPPEKPDAGLKEKPRLDTPEAERKELSREELLERVALAEKDKEKAFQTVERMTATRTFLPPRQETQAHSESEAGKPKQPSTDADRNEALRQEEEQRRMMAEKQRAAEKVIDERFIHTADGKYYPRNDSGHLAFQDVGNKLKAKDHDAQTAQSMVLMAQAKGWEAIKVNGNNEFKSKVWLEAKSRGMDVKGYTPNEKDLALLSERQLRDAKNTIEHTERTPSIPTDTATEKSANRKAIDAVTDSILKSRVTDPQKRETIRKEIGRKLDIYEKHGGNMPTLKTYDSKARKTAQDRIPVQRGERTR